jgi:hypothetical protein
LTFDGDQASRPGFGWHQDVPVTWHGLEFPNFEWGISGKDLAERCGISLGIFHGFSQTCGITMVFSMVFPWLFHLFFYVFRGFVNGLVALAEAIHWEVQGVRGPDQENNSHDGMVSTYPVVN